MRGVVTVFLLLWSCTTGLFTLTAQELRASVTVNGAALHGSSPELIHSMEESLHTFLNGQLWGESFMQSDQKVSCSFTLMLTDHVPDGSFRGELYVQSRKRGEAVGMGATMLVLRDRELEFNYSPYQPLRFDLHAIRDNLTAVTAYYSCLILALEQDAVESLGGTRFFRMMEQIASGAASNRWRGWEMNRRQGSRSSLAAAFNDGSLESFRLMWHRLHADPQLTTAAQAVEVLYTLYKEQPGNPMLTLFADGRLHELVSILAGGDRIDREQWLRQLREIYPTRNDALEKLRQ